MNILLLTVNLQNWVCDTLYKEQLALKEYVEQEGGKIYFYGPGYDYWTNNVHEVVLNYNLNGIKIDAILCYMSERQLLENMPSEFIEKYSVPKKYIRFPIGLEKINDVKKILWINDFWHMSPTEWRETIINNGFVNILATYSPPFSTHEVFNKFFIEEVRNYAKFSPCPRAIDPLVFYPRNDPKKYDVTLLGAMGPFYTDRAFFHESLSNQSWLKYFNVSHPGYKFHNHGEALFGEKYAEIISASKIFVNCTSIYNLPFIKLYEVLASNTLLMCTKINGANDLGLIDGVNFVEINRQDFLQKIRFYLENEVERKRVASSGYELFLTNHTLRHRAKHTYQLILNSNTQSISKPKGIIDNGEKGVIKKIISKLANFIKTNKTSVSYANIFETIKGGTRLDWKYVAISKHVIDVVNNITFDELKLIEVYGLNYQVGDKINITQHAEVVCYRPIILSKIADKINAKSMCEVGTARGLQSIFWIKSIIDRNIKDGILFTCDIEASDVPKYRTPLTGDNLFTRDELWRLERNSKYIKFVHGDSASLAVEIETTFTKDHLDMLYIDGGHTKEAVLYDFNNLRKFVAKETVIVFDDCDPRFPGVEEAVNEIAAQMSFSIALVTFWPSPYCVAIMGKSETISGIL